MSEITHQLYEAVQAIMDARAADKARLEAEQAQQAQLEAEIARKQIEAALMCLPDYMRPFIAWDSSHITSYHVCHLSFDFADIIAPMTVGMTRGSDEAWNIFGIRVNDVYMGEEGPVYAYGRFENGVHLEDALALAAENKAAFQRMSDEIAAKKKFSDELEAAQQAAEPAIKRAELAQREYNTCVLAVIESDPVLNGLLKLLFAVAEEREMNREEFMRLREAEAASDEEKAQYSRELQRLSDSLRHARAEADEADAQVRNLRKKLKS